jgi:hypothetical protein
VRYTVFSWDGTEIDTIFCLAPGGAAKLAVEERGFRPGLLVVVDEFGERTLWNAHATRLVFANEVRDG